jgi:hypothetical protein
MKGIEQKITNLKDRLDNDQKKTEEQEDKNEEHDELLE